MNITKLIKKRPSKRQLGVFALLLFMLAVVLLKVKHEYEIQPDPQQFFNGPVKWLGNPFAKRWPAGGDIYARNIWDMKAFQGKIYLGSGNSANDGPAPNAGPIDIWYFDPKLSTFVNEGEVNDEQIDVFKVIGDQLFIPGHDAAAPDNWDYGNYYQLADKRWLKHRSIPRGIHVYDIAEYKGELVATLGSHDYYGGLSISKDKGGTWTTYPTGFFRLFTLFEFDDVLYVSSLFKNEKLIQGIQKNWPEHEDLIPVSLYRYHEGVIQATALGIQDFFPGWELRAVKLRLPTHYKNSFVYIGARPSNDHQYAEQQLFSMENIGEGRRVSLPKNANPQDMLVDNDRLLLLSTEKSTGRWAYKLTVYETYDLNTWVPLIRFDADTLSRSFEYLHGCFYFGMGSDVRETGEWWPKWDLSPLTGSVLVSDCEF